MDLISILEIGGFVFGVIAIIIGTYAIYDAHKTKEETKKILEEIKSTALQISNSVSTVYIKQTQFAADLNRFNSGQMTTVSEARTLQTEIKNEVSKSDDVLGKILGGAIIIGVGLFILSLLGDKKR